MDFKIVQTPVIPNPLGDLCKIYHTDSPLYQDNAIGEIYKTSVKPYCFKGWKVHKEMTLNLFPIYGKVELLYLHFVLILNFIQLNSLLKIPAFYLFNQILLWVLSALVIPKQYSLILHPFRTLKLEIIRFPSSHFSTNF